MRPSAGTLNQRITILNPVPSTDAAGGPTTTYVEGRSVWAHVTFVGGSEVERDRFRVGDDTFIQVIMRPIYELNGAIAVTSEHRIKYRNREWDISSDPRIIDLDDALEFNARFGVVTV